MLIVPKVVIGGVVTENAGGTAACTLVTVPTFQVLSAVRSLVRPLIVMVLESGTGVYPNNPIMSPAVKGAAEVTNPFAFTANFRGVFDPYTLLLTVARVVVRGTPVTPTPETSPWRMMVFDGRLMATGVIFVTNPLPFTVTTGTVVEDPNVPGETFTVARVNGTLPGPDAVPSPVRSVM
jgi:hypothetical protein